MAILADTHLHSSFSGDSDTPMEEMIQTAIQKGLKIITFTEHMDYDYPITDKTPEGTFEVNTDSYLFDLLRFRAKYDGQIKINFGIELGLQPSVVRKNLMLVKNYDFDFVIASSHLCHGIDTYCAPFYEGRSTKEAMTEYFESILENLKVYSNFDTYGHLDYPVRYVPGKATDYHYADYTDLIDEILTILIDKEKALEVNTGSYRNGLNEPNPSIDILRRYKELGGELLTIGSDAHSTKHIADGFDRVRELLVELGYKYYAVYENRIPENKLL